MQSLVCDINLGGSTYQYLDWSKRNLSKAAFVGALTKALSYRAKTRPKKLAKRFGCLIGIIYSEFNGDAYLLDCVIEAFHKVEDLK